MFLGYFSPLGKGGLVGGVTTATIAAVWEVVAAVQGDPARLGAVMAVFSLVVLGVLPRLALMASGLTALSGTGKAAAAAKALSIAGKAGEVIDPMTYIFKGAGAGISKIGDAMAHLKGLGHVEAPKISEGAFSLPEGAVKMPDGTVQLPKGSAVRDGAIKLPDGSIKLPEGTVTLPPNTVKSPFDGPGKYMDAAGHLYKEDGSLFKHAEDAPTGKPAPSATDADNPRIETPVRQEQPVLTGVRTQRRCHTSRLGHIRPVRRRRPHRRTGRRRPSGWLCRPPARWPGRRPRRGPLRQPRTAHWSQWWPRWQARHRRPTWTHWRSRRRLARR